MVAVLTVLTMGSTAPGRGQGEETPLKTSGAASAPVSAAAASPGCGAAPQSDLNNGWSHAGGEDVTFVDDVIR
ncbi:hypothetical protein [Streptomyces fradiae]|uniref:hypothetical protein n=1 Tax=Streptomyces fradiae TaxID=1906 RepID=UPI003511A598